MEKLIALVIILFLLYILILFMIGLDFWSGIRKAKKNNIVRSSYGFRRTVEKIKEYYNAMTALTIIDAMQVSVIWYLETYYQYSIPMFPFITLLGAIGLSAIEVKSIYEKAEDKQRFHEAGTLITSIAKKRTNIEEISKSVAEYLKQNTDEKAN